MKDLNLDVDKLQLVSNTIRMLSVEAIKEANSGHPGMPLGMADIASVLWLKHLNYSSSDLNWLNRDRFVLSNGHGSMLLYSILHLTESGLSLSDLKDFRKLGSKTPGHPESFITEGVECTTGPLGQGVGNAVGLAIAGKIFSSKYNTSKEEIFNHKVYAFAGDGCLMEGISSEASSLAGHLGLDNLILIYDDNNISIAGDTNLTFSEDVEARYKAYNWHTIKIDGHNYSEIDKAFTEAKSIKGKPVLIIAKTIIGKGSITKENTCKVHGSPLNEEEIKNMKKSFSFLEDKSFYVKEEVREIFRKRNEYLENVYKDWTNNFYLWSKNNKELKDKLDRQLSLSVPEDFYLKLSDKIKVQEKKEATRKLSSTVLQEASSLMESLIGGSSDLEPSTLTLISDSKNISKDDFSSKNIYFGIREHAMGAIMNGLVYYGGFFPYGSTFLVFSDYVRPAIRVAALSKLPSLYIFTHDSIFVGEDGPTHQPIEQIMSLRSIPNLTLFRPADGAEVSSSYALSLKNTKGPSVLILSRQGINPLPKKATLEDVSKGAYISSSIGESEDMIFVATGSEVSLAIEVAELINKEKRVGSKVISMPSVELYKNQDTSYKEKLIPKNSKVVVIEAGISLGWRDIIKENEENLLLVGINTFGASAPGKDLAKKFNFTKEEITKKIIEKFF